MKPLIRIICLCGLFLATAAQAIVVTDIRAVRRDGRPVDLELIEAYTKTRTGMDISRDLLSADIDSLRDSGRFSYVAMDIPQLGDQLSLVYVVEPKFRIRRLSIDGANLDGNRKIRELLALEVGDLVDDATLAVKAKAVREWYQKKHYPFATLTWDLEEQPDGMTADVRIEVKEGQRARIHAINFSGNHVVDDKALRKTMLLKKRGLFSWLTGSGVYDPDKMGIDRVALRDVYMDRGFLDVSIGEPEIVPVSSSKVNVEIPVVEGEQYFIGEVSLKGVTLFPHMELESRLRQSLSEVASVQMLNRASGMLRDYYGSRGYINTRVSYRLNPTVSRSASGAAVVDVEFTVREGSLAYIRSIDIVGNVVTRDKVIRRELAVYPGEVVNEVKLRTSEQRLRGLQYFSFVNSTPVPTEDPEQYDVEFEVKEQNTGQFQIGAGFSSIDSLIGFVQIQKSNFDLYSWPPVGGGQSIMFRGTLGTKRQDVELKWSDPWFLDRRLNLGTALFRRNSQFLSDEYDQQNTGGRVSLGFPVLPFTRMNLTYGLEEIRVYNVDDTASDLIKAEEGTRIKSSLSPQLRFDTRDHPLIPTRGMKSTLTGTVAGGPLGGETDIYGLEFDVTHYWPLWFDHVFLIHGWLSGVDAYGRSDSVPIFDRLFLGGARTLRGFDYRDVGPKDETGEPVGGLSGWFASAEYTIPLSAQFRLAGFYDIGMVHPEAFSVDFGDYNSDVGLGIRVDIPGFPLRLDYAWPQEADEFNDRSSGRFQFSLGYSY